MTQNESDGNQLYSPFCLVALVLALGDPVADVSGQQTPGPVLAGPLAAADLAGLRPVPLLPAHGLAFVTVYAVANGAAQRWFPVERRGLIASIVAR